MLDSAKIEFYRENGYLMLENAIGTRQLASLQAVTKSFIEASRSVSQSNDIFELDEGHSPVEPRLTRIKVPHSQHSEYRDVMLSTTITSVVSALIGPDIRLHNSKLNTKAPGGGAAVEWHQDWAFYPHTNDDLLAIGIMLDDVDRDNGPLLVIPGSHKGPVLDHSANGVFCGAINPRDSGFNAGDAVALTGKAGSMSVHHVRTLHGSAPNLSERTRMLLFLECGAADAWPIAGNASAYTGLNQQDFWKQMQERMMCGQQTLSPRLADVPVIMPLPPAPDSASIFKVQRSGGAVSAFTSGRQR